MPTLRNYRLLISHSWRFSDQYEKIKGWLDQTSYFRWSNHSVSADRPYNTRTKTELRAQLTNQIRGCCGVIVVSGMYASYSEWIDYEINEAVRMGKPIIGVKPWGSERVPSKISNNATVLVGWNCNSVVNAVRDYALKPY